MNLSPRREAAMRLGWQVLKALRRVTDDMAACYANMPVASRNEDWAVYAALKKRAARAERRVARLLEAARLCECLMNGDASFAS